MSAGVIVNVAKQANAEQLGAAKASAQFASELENSSKVYVILTAEQQTTLQRELGFVPIYENTKKVSHDHPVLFALRSLAREDVVSMLTKTTTTPTHFIGCAGFELGNNTLFSAPAFSFSVHTEAEPKDLTRIVPTAILQLSKKLRAKLTDSDRAVLKGNLTKKPSSALQHYSDVKDLIKAFGTGDFTKVPRVQLGVSGKHTRLVSFDSFYNLFDTDYLRMFSSTGAVEMYCVGLLPFELLFDHMPDNDLYAFRQFRSASGVHMSALNYRGGYSDGYVHETAAWSTLLTRKVLRSPMYGFSINVEIQASFGPMRVVKLSRAGHSGHVFRSIELPQHLRFVRVLDLVASYRADPSLHKLSYFSVYECEFWSLIDYLLNIDPKSVTTPNACAYIRRNKAGVSMAGKDYMPAWQLKDEHVMPLAVAAVAYAIGTITAADDVLKATGQGAYREVNWLNFLKNALASVGVILSLGLAIPVKQFVDWLFSKNLFEKLVLTPDMEVVSYANLGLYVSRNTSQNAHIALDLTEFADDGVEHNDMGPEYDSNGKVTWLGSHPKCPTCRLYKLKRQPGDRQLILCDFKEHSEIDWSMTQEDNVAFKNKLIEDSTARDVAPQLAATLREGYESIPAGQLAWKGRGENIAGPPGTGKSFFLRMMYDDSTLIYSTQGKLRQDYMAQKRADGSTYDMTFKTTHKGMKSYGKQNIFVDEWTTMDQRCLLVSLINNGAKELKLFGDVKQTCIQPQEGVFIGRKTDIDELSTHTLMVNFRNPLWSVAVMNKDHQYTMYCDSDVEGRPIFHPLAEAAAVTEYEIMTFANVAATYLASQDPNSVRRNQGGTHEKIGLVVSDADKNLLNNDNLFRVAISRHKKELHIFVEPGTEMDVAIRARLHVGDAAFERDFKKLARPDMKQFVRYADSKPTPVEEFEAMGIYAFSDPKDEFALPTPPDDTSSADIEWCTAQIVNEILDAKATQEYKDWVVEKRLYKGKFVPLDALITFMRKHAVALHIFEGGKPIYREKLLNLVLREVQIVVECVESDVPNHVRLATAEEVFCTPKLRWKFRVGETGDVKAFSARYGSELRDKLMCAFPTELRFRMSLPEFTDEVLQNFRDKYMEHAQRSKSVPIFVLNPVIEKPINRIYAGKWKDENALVQVTHAAPSLSLYSRMRRYVNRPLEDFAPRDTLPEVRRPTERPLQPARDAWFLADTLSPIFSVGYHARFLNEKYAAQGFANVPRNGVLSANWTLPVNSRGHPIREMDKTYQGQALSIGEGLKYHGKSNLQALQAVAHRYLRRRKVFRFNNQAKDFAISLSRGFQRRHMNPVKIDFHKEADIIREWQFVAAQRLYAKRADGEGEDARNVIRFHLKDIFKPLKDMVVPSQELFQKVANLAKCGQGISAWSATANIEFGAMTRVINHRFLTSLKDHVVYNNKFSEDEIDQQLARLKRVTLPGAKTAVTDGADFDSMQNRFTQEIEREHSRFLGVPEMALDGYYELRNDYKMTQNGLFTARCASEKTSGEPGTLLYNSQLGGTVTDNAVIGIGPVTMKIQGDDAAKTQSCLRVDEEVLRKLSLYSEFKLKCEIGENQEFCGNVEIGGTLVPSVHRLFKKCMAHVERGEKTFYEYKMSVFDKIERIERVGAETVIAASAAAVKCSFQEMSYVYDVVKSYSHLSYEQFASRSRSIHGPDGWFM